LRFFKTPLSLRVMHVPLVLTLPHRRACACFRPRLCLASAIDPSKCVSPPDASRSALSVRQCSYGSIYPRCLFSDPGSTDDDHPLMALVAHALRASLPAPDACLATSVRRPSFSNLLESTLVLKRQAAPLPDGLVASRTRARTLPLPRRAEAIVSAVAIDSENRLVSLLASATTAARRSHRRPRRRRSLLAPPSD
jgi:hypothetical protein